MKKGDIRKDSLYTPEEGVIPPGDTAPPYENLLGYVWKRVWSWFRGTAEGGIYETLVDVTHYARGWWTWHVVSDPSQISGGLAGWASRVYDYFQNWPTRAWEWFENKVGRLEWTFRPTAEGGIWQHLSDTFDRFGASFAQFRDNPTDYVKKRARETWPDISAILDDPVDFIRKKLGWARANWNLFWQNPFHYIVQALGGDVRVWDYFVANPIEYIGLKVSDWIQDHFPWLWDLIGYIVEKIGLTKAQWNHFWQNPLHYVIQMVGGDIRVWDYFIANPVEYIWIRIGDWILERYPSLYDEYQWLTTRWHQFTREVGAFIDNPYVYLTGKLQAWIEGWRDYIFGVVGDLFMGFQSSITDGLVRLTINLLPLRPVGRLPTRDYADLDTFIESMRWWLEGDGAKQKDGYNEVFEWAEENVLKEKRRPHVR